MFNENTDKYKIKKNNDPTNVEQVGFIWPKLIFGPLLHYWIKMHHILAQ